LNPHKLSLTDDQKEKALSLFKENPSLLFVTQNVFEDSSLDGRSKEGRAIRAFLGAQGKEYVVQESIAKKTIHLTESQKQLLMSDQISSKMSPVEIARVVFNDPSVKSLSAQHRAVQDFLGKYRDDVIDENAFLADGKWHPPRSVGNTIRRINKWCDAKLNEDPEKLVSKQKKAAEKLMGYLNIYKFENTINCFKTESDRELFESEFVRATWDKPDLTSDDLNLYMMVCSNHVRGKHIQRRLDSFSAMLQNEDLEANEINIKLTEYIKATSEELNACEKRIESLTAKLNSTRSDRLKRAVENNANILSLVEEFQNKEGRDRMILAAEMRSKLVENEADRLESMDEFKARVFGISKDELL
jgi:hypothetical protein